MTELTDLLRQVRLLKMLPEEDLDRLAMHTRRVVFEPNTDIVEIGEVDGSLYLILDGLVRVLYPSHNSDFELARLGPGDFFGEMALLNDRPRSATVRSVDSVVALVLDRGEFRRVVTERPEVALQILEALSVRIRTADEQISTLNEQAMRDPLTSLMNRRAFEERTAQEVDLHRRYGRPFSLVLLDLDDFKRINDTLGHDVGDEVLTWVGRILLEHTRAADSAFRVGGEEFAVLCPATDAKTARTVARRLVGVIGEARPPLQLGLNVTASGGYASCPEHSDGFEGLYRLADQALYRAKESGRDRVGEPVPAP